MFEFQLDTNPSLVRSQRKGPRKESGHRKINNGRFYTRDALPLWTKLGKHL